MPASSMTQIDRAMDLARARTKAEVAQKLAKGLPIATAERGVMELQQIQDGPGPDLVTAGGKGKYLGRRALKTRLAVKENASLSAELPR